MRAFGKTVPRHATLYVTMEPCSTAGRTPPCTEAIIAGGIANVVLGAVDPNPRHAGRASTLLRRRGIAVETGVLGDECSQLNESYNKWIRTGEPFVIAKCGMSLDGRLTRPPGETRWLTSKSAREHARKLRGQIDAILIGADTLRADDPRLSVRGGGSSPPRQPWRVVLTRSAKLPAAAKIFTDRWADRTLIYRNQNLPAVLRDLGKRDVTSVLIEGGGDVLGQALDAHLIDKVQLYIAPIFTSGPVPAFAGKGAAATENSLRLIDPHFEIITGDICVSGHLTHKKSN